MILLWEIFLGSARGRLVGLCDQGIVPVVKQRAESLNGKIAGHHCLRYVVPGGVGVKATVDLSGGDEAL